MSEPSGIHLTGEDSGWPVDDLGTLADGSGYPYKYDGTWDYWAHPDAVNDGVITLSEAQYITVSSMDPGKTATVSMGTDTAVLSGDGNTAAEVQAALESLNEIEPGDVHVVALPPTDISPTRFQYVYVVYFTGNYAGEDVPSLEVENVDLAGLIMVNDGGVPGGELVCPG